MLYNETIELSKTIELLEAKFKKLEKQNSISENREENPLEENVEYHTKGE